MKTIRSLMTMFGLFLALYALGSVGVRAQTVDSTQFVGTFTLSSVATWGGMTLPAGNYILSYGTIYGAGSFVEVRGEAKGSPHAAIPAGPADQTSAKKNAIICIRYGNSLFVRALEMPVIGQAVTFATPRSARLVANHRDRSTFTQLAEGPILIQRVPVTLNAK